MNMCLHWRDWIEICSPYCNWHTIFLFNDLDEWVYFTYGHNTYLEHFTCEEYRYGDVEL